MRLYQAELLMDAKACSSNPSPKLNEWLRGYAISAAKDKVQGKTQEYKALLTMHAAHLM